MLQNNESPPAKRRKVADDLDTAPLHEGLTKPISPPLLRQRAPGPAVIQSLSEPSWGFDDVPKQTVAPLWPTNQTVQTLSTKEDGGGETSYMASPIQLTRIQDLAPEKNVDTLSLKDILGDPLIRECWNFNFLFNLDFVMQQFDHDVRDLVKVKIVHGFWKRDDERRIRIMETAERYPNLEPVAAYLPDVFGTHHSKMMILFRHDGYVQVVIHTANMIPKDWANMTQAVWRSPLLPLCTPPLPPSSSETEVKSHPIGSGERFKADLLQYLGKYENRLRDLTGQLPGYDFSAVRAAFIGSAPSRQKLSAADPARYTSFGWLGLKEILSKVPASTVSASPHIVLQISSIATLGPTTKWLSNFQSVLAHSSHSKSAMTSRAPKFNIIFPTAEEIRTSLDGYASGGSIHMKVQSVQQQKQLEYSRPLFCHWKHPSPPSSRRKAHRGPAAPHIKTYIRFTDDHDERIDWVMVTSANLSKQAWGEVPNKDNEVRIQSYETGVVVWPGLFADSPGAETTMVPVFGKDTPAHGDVKGVAGKVGTDDETEDEETEDEDDMLPAPSTPRPPSASVCATTSIAHTSKFIGFRMPYDLPLSPYTPGDEPWCASMPNTAPDWMGRRWTG